MAMEDWPATLEINAWLGDRAATSDLAKTARKLASDPAGQPVGSAGKLAPEVVSPSDWRHPTIGWGLIVREGTAIPDPIQALLDDRPGSPVLHYRPGILTHLRNPLGPVDLPIVEGPGGVASPSSLPHYLLIYGTPMAVPWELQYLLNRDFHVGRLDLEGTALENYVSALIDEWDGAACDIQQAIVWSVVQDVNGITRLMRTAIGERVFKEWQTDTNATFRQNVAFLDGGAEPATAAGLVKALEARRPALIVTTSHGRTSPLDKPDDMRARLGHLVDQAGTDVAPADALAAWQPDGAVWYAHACCSAGSSAETQFDEQFGQLVPKGGDVDRVLKGVAALGSLMAPFPRALLGAAKPLRAFIGHVEPTFDLSLRDVGTGKHLTGLLRAALYQQIYTRQPIGLAFSRWLDAGGAFSDPYNKALTALNKNDPGARKLLLAYKLLHRDHRSTVILGDPTVALPPLP